MNREWTRKKLEGDNKTVNEIGTQMIYFLKECPFFTKEEKKKRVTEVETAMEYGNVQFPWNGKHRETYHFKSICDFFYEPEGKTEESMKIFHAWMKKREEIDMEGFVSALNNVIHTRMVEDSKPMEFHGDVVITDPFYLMNEKDPDEQYMFEVLEPKKEEYFTYKCIRDYPDYKEVAPGLGTYYSAQYSKEEEEYRQAHHAYMVLADDWAKCRYGNRMDLLGIHKCMIRDSLCSEWGCTMFSIDKNGLQKEIGTFCADTSQIAVADLGEVAAYNPSMWRFTGEYAMNATIVKGFDGTAQFVVKEVNPDEKKGYGKGNLFPGYEVEVILKGTYVNEDGIRETCNLVGRQTWN